MSLKEWEKVFESALPPRVSIAQALLAEHDIQSVILNKQDSSYHFGKCELYVSQLDAILARIILDTELPDEGPTQH